MASRGIRCCLTKHSMLRRSDLPTLPRNQKPNAQGRTSKSGRGKIRGQATLLTPLCSHDRLRRWPDDLASHSVAIATTF